jgi:hypothetical protein
LVGFGGLAVCRVTARPNNARQRSIRSFRKIQVCGYRKSGAAFKNDLFDLVGITTSFPAMACRTLRRSRPDLSNLESDVGRRFIGVLVSSHRNKHGRSSL